MAAETSSGDAGIRGAAVAKKSLKHKAYDLIKQRIILGEMPGGSPVSEQALVEELGISRTPIREALNMLQHEHLVEIYPKQGIFVTRVSYKDVVDIYSLRILLEPFAAKVATERIERSVLEEQYRLWESLDEKISSSDHVRIDRELHSAIAEATGNRYLINYLHQLYDQANRIRFISLKRYTARMGETHAEHVRILGCMLQHDAEGAGGAMRAHLENARDTALRYFAE